MTPVDPTAAALRSRVLRGLAWKLGSRVFFQSFRIVLAVFLARLLAPHDYGLAGLVLVFETLVFIFSDLALGAALIQRKELTEDDRSTAFWTSVAGGVFFTAVGIAISGPVAHFYGEPAVKPLFAVFSLNFALATLGVTQVSLLARAMDFRSLELRIMAGTLVGGIVGIVAAAKGYGAWALIAQGLTVSLVSTVLLWMFCPWRPKLRFSLASLRDLGGFSGNVFGMRLLFYANRNTDNLLIGRFLGPAALGAYSLAYNVMLVPFDQIAQPIQDVLFPAFSRIQNEADRIAATWIRVNRLVGAISIPSLLGLEAVAPDFVHVVLGDRWRAATPIVQILVWVGLLQSLQSLNPSVLQARDRTGTLLRFTIVATVANIGAFVVGLRWGIVGVATSFAVASTFVLPLFTLVTARSVGASAWAFARGLAGVVQAALAMLACVVGVRLLLVHEHVPPGARLAIAIVVGAAVYLPCCAWRAPEVLDEIRQLLPAARRGRVPMPAVQASESHAG